MNATEAKKKADAKQATLKTQREKRINALLQEIYKIIDEAASNGKYKETYTFNVIADPAEVRDGVVRVLKEVGYKITYGDVQREVLAHARGLNNHQSTITIHWD